MIEPLDLLLARWSVANAWGLLVAVAITFLAHLAVPLAVAAGLSFAILIAACRGRWTASDAFGYANSATALRLLGILGVAIFHTHLSDMTTVVVALGLLVADAIDGWLARRFHEQSAFGAYFDKEADALYTLVMVTVLVLEGRIGGWLLSAGLLRYLFVLMAPRAKPDPVAEQRTWRAGVVSVAVNIALLACFVLPRPLAGPIAALATAALVASFSVDICAWFTLGRLHTTVIHDHAAARAFFDTLAARYGERHGEALRLLDYRLRLIRGWAQLASETRVLDLGCGTGTHLLALADQIDHGVGIDFSPRMIAAAKRGLSGTGERIEFRVDDAATLATLANESIDVAICIGVMEHLLDKQAAVTSTHRVLRAGGRFICLTTDGHYLWYRAIAPRLGVATRHLSTDRLLSADELRSLLQAAGFSDVTVRPWTFIPRGDVSPVVAMWLGWLDLFGRLSRVPGCRGGLLVCAAKGAD